MNSRDRVPAAIKRKPVDRIPTDIWATGEVWARLRAHFGESADIGQELHIDGFAGVGPEYRRLEPPMRFAPSCVIALTRWPVTAQATFSHRATTCRSIRPRRTSSPCTAKHGHTETGPNAGSPATREVRDRSSGTSGTGHGQETGDTGNDQDIAGIVHADASGKVLDAAPRQTPTCIRTAEESR